MPRLCNIRVKRKLDVDRAVDLLRKPIRREALLSVVHLALQQNDRP
jgi:FixJ family two-component response regulator